ncbi:MAG: ribosome assembly factor SBDS [Nanoarchaeota archaeon]|nr:ribosome assembly factor SBDS [Nanoarchaeota archaeon]|tara:strand:+ start:3299 stop:4003 length:705 start_codon:yes stop_codon:yes gene_type:complete
MERISKEKIKLNLARLKRAGHTFEIDINPENATAYVNGEMSNIHEVLNAERVFSDAKKGELVSNTLLQEVFETSDPLKVADIILRQGEIQSTSEQRNAEREQKRKRVVELIRRNAVDPSTNIPHPAERIERAMEEARVSVDDAISAEDQIQTVVDKLRIVLPIRLEERSLNITIPSQYAAKLYGLVGKYGKLQKENWNSDGSWTTNILIPAGLQEELMDKLNSETHGGVQIEVN